MPDLNTVFQNVLCHLIALYRPVKRNRGLPYITHPLEVMAQVKSMPEKLLALIHDYNELRDPAGLTQYGVPDVLIERMRLLAKPFPADGGENDPRYRNYIWTWFDDPMIRRIKYFDLLTNGGYEEFPRPLARSISVECPRLMKILAEAEQGRIWFYSKSFLFDIFSNFYAQSFVQEAISWRCVEQYYQSRKFAPDSAAFARLRESGTGGEAKAVAEAHAEDILPDWTAERKIAVMRQALSVKFAPGTEMADFLRKTGELELIHESGSDMFWGRPRSGDGENNLGLILMALRAKL